MSTVDPYFVLVARTEMLEKEDRDVPAVEMQEMTGDRELSFPCSCFLGTLCEDGGASRCSRSGGEREDGVASSL